MSVRNRAEDLKAKLGIGGIHHVGWQNRITLQRMGMSNTTVVLLVRRTRFERKPDDVTQGGLIVSILSMVNLIQVCDRQVEIMGGEKSEQGIVVNKLTRKAAKVSDLILSY